MAVATPTCPVSSSRGSTSCGRGLVAGGAPPPWSDRLELLEGLAAALAVADRAARRRTEDVLEARLGRAAVRALERLALELHELRAAGLTRCGRREARRAELGSALGRDPVRRPRVVEHDLDVGLGAELADPLGHLVAHHLERRTAEEGRRELDMHGPVLDGHAPHDAEVDDGDRRDLRVRNLRERFPDALFRYHVAPATERRTSVISSQSCSNSGRCSPRWSTSGRSSSSASWNCSSSWRRSNHMWACIRWYASSRSIFAARPATSGSSDSVSSLIRRSSASSYRQWRAIVLAQSGTSR